MNPIRATIVCGRSREMEDGFYSAFDIFVPKDEGIDVLYFQCGICKEWMDVLEDDEYFRIDDYVNGNCFYWCPNCDEVFICPDTEVIVDIFNGKSDGCTNIVEDEEEKLRIIKECTDMNEKLQYIVAKVGLLVLTYILPSDHSEKGTYSDRIEYFEKYSKLTNRVTLPIEEQAKLSQGFHISEEKNCITFNEARKYTGNKLSHDGTVIEYVGKCTCCSRIYEGQIWGD